MSPRRSAPLTIEHVLLALLDPRPMHGYELYQALSQTQGISLIWNVTQSMLYVLLDKLEAHGLLASEVAPSNSHPPRKIFHITEMGRQTLYRWMKTPVRRAREMRQEFLAKLIAARRYGQEDALELIHAQRQACLDWLGALQADNPVKETGPSDGWLVYSYRAHRLDSILEWLDVCERELTREQPST